MGFWDFFKSKENDESKSDESVLPKDSSKDLTFAKNFTDSGGRFIFIDEINSTKEVFEKLLRRINGNQKMFVHLIQIFLKTLKFDLSGK